VLGDHHHQMANLRTLLRICGLVIWLQLGSFMADTMVCRALSATGEVKAKGTWQCDHKEIGPALVSRSWKSWRHVHWQDCVGNLMYTDQRNLLFKVAELAMRICIW